MISGRTVEVRDRRTLIEVKTIGDSFMAAFADAVDAVLCGCAVQEGLADASWAEVPAFRVASDKWPRRLDPASGAALWHGIAVRIGVAAGDVARETNPLTQRTDYRGRAVNLATRAPTPWRVGCREQVRVVRAARGGHRRAGVRRGGAAVREATSRGTSSPEGFFVLVTHQELVFQGGATHPGPVVHLVHVTLPVGMCQSLGIPEGLPRERPHIPASFPYAFAILEHHHPISASSPDTFAILEHHNHLLASSPGAFATLEHHTSI
eukprot:gene57604-biopygen21010